MIRIAAALLGVLLGTVPAAAGAVECGARAGNDAPHEQSVRRGHEIRFEPLIARINSQLAAGGKIDVLMIGDSITQRWPQQRLGEALGGRKFINAGIPGDDTGALMWRLSEREEPARVNGKDVRIGIKGWKNIKPRDVVLLIGTNDLPKKADGCDVFGRIEAVIAKLHATYPEASLTVISVLPRGERMSQFEHEISEINTSLARSVERLKVRFLDAHDAFLCGRQTNCPLMIPGTNVHPSAEGYEVLGKLLTAHLAGS